MTENVCFSGAAIGADELFGILAGLSLHHVVHFSFLGHKYKSEKAKAGTVRVLVKDQLQEANPHLNKVKKVINRTFPTRSEYVNNLLRRNWWQVKDTDAVYAVSTLENNIVKGGTAWAVHIAILKEVPEVYVFDQSPNHERWYKWFYDRSGWYSVSHVPKPKGKYTGIGTRDLNKAGTKAIRDLYRQED